MSDKDTMLGRLIRILMTVPADFLGALVDLGEKLASKEGREWFAWLKKFLRQEEVGWKQIVRLTFVATHQIPATTTPLTCDLSFGKRVLGSAFLVMFIGKVEEPQPETTVIQYELRQRSTRLEMLADLGGGIKAKTTMTTIKSLMDKQAKGESGVLWTDGRRNIFFVEDQQREISLVCVRWSDGGWGIGSDIPREDCEPQSPAGSRVFSSN